jgi:hypothetical protein
MRHSLNRHLPIRDGGTCGETSQSLPLFYRFDVTIFLFNSWWRFVSQFSLKIFVSRLCREFVIINTVNKYMPERCEAN